MSIDKQINYIVNGTVKGKENMWTRDIKKLTPEALRYGTRCQGISQCYLHICAFIYTNGMNQTCFAFSAEAGSHSQTQE